MFRSVMVTAFKGGVGKSTVAACLGDALAVEGEKVLLVDCDFSNRCLDLILGVQDAVLSDLSDLMSGARLFADCLIPVPPHEDKLFLLAAPYDLEPQEAGFTEGFLKKLIASAEGSGFDRVLFDTPGDAGYVTRIIASVCEEAIVVARNLSTSVRGAEKTAVSLFGWGVKNCSLLLNFFSPKKAGSSALSLTELIDRTSVGLIGIVPLDPALVLLQEAGKLPSGDDRKARNTRAAFRNTARRMRGETVPLLTSFRGIDRGEWLN